MSAQYDVPSEWIFGMTAGAWIPVRHMKFPDGHRKFAHRDRKGEWIPLTQNDLAVPPFERVDIFGEPDAFIHSSHVRRFGFEFDTGPLTPLLAGLGGCDLDALGHAIQRDSAEARELVAEPEKRINEHLDRDFVGFPGLRVRFSVMGQTLELDVATNDSSFRLLSEQSAGIQLFLAVVAAVHWSEKRDPAEPPPILLIDELESHLHVDAQTDLMQYLEAQETIPQLIYTTHSMTCLPADLGTGLRAISPTGIDRSEIVNSVWSHKHEAGPSPVFIAAGATSSALAAFRRAVFTEGASDPILLPSMLCEATDRVSLDFQCLPGLAWVARGRPEPLLSAAARTVHVVDGDPGGGEIAGLLREMGVVSEDIIVLGGGSQHDVVTEDLLAAELYAEAVTDTATRSNAQGVTTLRPAAIRGEWNRPRAVARWASEQGISEPSKVDVAERVIELAEWVDRPLLEHSRAGMLRELFGAIDQRLAAV